MKHPCISTAIALGCLFSACKPATNNEATQANAQAFLDAYNQKYQALYYEDNLAQWQLNTRIVAGDTTQQQITDAADKAFADFTGSKENIDSAQHYLKDTAALTPLQVRQFETILFYAGNTPATAGDVVARRIKAQNTQTAALYGFRYTIDGKPVTSGKIDEILATSTDLPLRRSAWTASKEVGKALKVGLDSLQNLRNASVAPLGYKNFFDYNAREYGMSEDEVLQLTRKFIAEVWPLYRELHTWARYELAAKYKQPVPAYLPADWLPNRWGQDWTALVQVEGLNFDKILKERGVTWMAKEGENFYSSLGFDSLPATFWTRSSLYSVPVDSPFSKNNHASAWHLDLNRDVRSLQSITPTTEYWSTVLHEFGHIYYFLSYSNPNIPFVLRNGANRGFHEAFGTMMGLASLQKPFLEGRNLIPANTKTNDTLKLLQEALDYVVHIPWGSGVMTEFEYQLYVKKIPQSAYNRTWWDLVKKYQGIEPPTERGEIYCDAATKTHINDDAAQYYDYSIANVLVFQFHDYIAKNILHQDPHATNYWGNKEVGNFLKKVMEPGASVSWQSLLKTSIGQDMSAQAMVDYFAPLMTYLKHVNAGRNYTLPEKI
ncbi:peptidyl-dipeptidase A [Chitinophaga skermanii]|uniref:Peptidyl-dipeptidase A n=1 Tax=Chitinophaga skermanii TaxID=331697 RepID=A0A327Q220_9BACT|nr:M2 family metallopeptidase [Chitinophaga skermanii]RAI98515.1 peptidyl-dipeptidase A [Chitinophaga skermanii]